MAENYQPQTLPAGIPVWADYQQTIESKEFSQLEKFSDSFVAKTDPLLSSYIRHWVTDPLHQWSRQWEYSYVRTEVSGLVKNKKPCRILDLGSGITFMPFYLAGLPNVEVVCLDYDPSLKSQFQSVNRALSREVEFIRADMRKLPIDPESFDIVYCVSVLEHTDNYEQIIKNIRTVLKKGGSFILTFDISLDGRDDIPVPAADKLLVTLRRYFTESYKAPELKAQIARDIVTTKKVANFDKKLLPWKYPLVNVVRPLLSLRSPGSMYKDLTFYCSRFTKS